MEAVTLKVDGGIWGMMTKMETVTMNTEIKETVDVLEAFDQEMIPDGKSSYINLGNNGFEERNEWKQKKRRANRLKRKKKDKYKRDARQD